MGARVVDFEKARAAGRTQLVKKVKRHKDGALEIELYDAQAALVHIGRHLGLFADRQLSIDVSKLSEEQLERIASGEDPIHVLANPGAGGA